MNRNTLHESIVPGCIAAFAVLALSSNASAFVVQPADVTASSTQGTTLVDVINGDGLSDASIVVTNDPEPGTYPSHAATHDTSWRTNEEVAGATITFDLGGDFDLNGIRLWNYNETFEGAPQTARGMAETEVSISLDGGTTFAPAETFTFAEATGDPSYTGETYDFASTQSGVTDVRFTAVTGHGSDRVGLSEVRFTAVPEPSVALLGGLGIFGLLRRRRS